jgi:hypothetical protein
MKVFFKKSLVEIEEKPTTKSDSVEKEKSVFS